MLNNKRQTTDLRSMSSRVRWHSLLKQLNSDKLNNSEQYTTGDE